MMECPYCKKEMSSGYIFDGRCPVHWIPEDKNPAVLAFNVAKGGVVLRRKLSSAIGGYRAEAYYCEDSHVVIAKTEG